MREICLDTETTGLDPKNGHRIIEIGCIELINKIRTGKHYHTYINPDRDIPQEAFKIHGLSNEFLSDKPKFSQIAQDFINFIDNTKLVIHNADFDMKFINHELRNIGLEIIERGNVIDSLEIARNKFPGSPNSLDALCKRFKIDSSKRVKHGALLDAELLADVYLELMGGSQSSMFEEGNSYNIDNDNNINPLKNIADKNNNRTILESRCFEVCEKEVKLHKEFITKHLKNNFWNY